MEVTSTEPFVDMSRFPRVVLASSAAILLLGLLFYSMNTSTEGRVGAFGYRELMPVLSLTFLVMGSLVLSRVRTNPVGWFLLVVGTINAIDFFAENYATYGVLTKP